MNFSDISETTKSKLKQFESSQSVTVLPLIILDSSIDQDFVHNVIKFYRTIPETAPVLIILHIPEGGSSDDCSKICHAITNHDGHTTVFVPETALSTGAQIALSGDTLIMGKNACLSPFDDQLDDVPAKEMAAVRQLLKTPSKKSKKRKRVEHLAGLVSLSLDDYANVIESKRVLKITENEVSKMLKRNYGKKTVKRVMDTFVHHDKYHAYPLYADDLRNTGLNVQTEVLPDYYELFDCLHDAVKSKNEQDKRLRVALDENK